ncbi:MAG TPA: ABC transporter permease subunit [Acidimicrobiales bacterium]|nr:ABC transporter permease subunit [Acidimicrobiales bacterium]
MSTEDPRGYRAAELGSLVGEGRTVGSSLVAHLRRALPGAVGLALFAGSWQLVALALRVSTHGAFPTLGAIWGALTGDLSGYLTNAGYTLEEVVVGLGLSFAVAFSLAVVMVYVPVVERAVMPLAVILNVTPIVAIAPGLTSLLGLGMAPRYVVTALIVFFPLLINSLVGLGNVDPESYDLLRTLNASRTEVLVRLRLPSSLPYLFVAARICFPLATVGAVVAEFSTAGSGGGLGSAISVAANAAAYPSVYAAIFCLAVVGLVLTLFVSAAERRLLVWHPGRRRELSAAR